MQRCLTMTAKTFYDSLNCGSTTAKTQMWCHMGSWKLIARKSPESTAEVEEYGI
jgi:hypothetical protein